MSKSIAELFREQMKRDNYNLQFVAIGLPSGEWYKVSRFAEPPHTLTPEMRIEPPDDAPTSLPQTSHT